MRCPNCRCIIPGSANKCAYCGFRMETGSMRRITISEAYGDGFFGKPERFRHEGSRGASGELTYNRVYQNGYASSRYARETEESDGISFQTLATLLLGMCAVFLLLLIALLLLLI